MRMILPLLLLVAVLLAGCSPSPSSSPSSSAKGLNRYVVVWASPYSPWRAIYETNAYTERDGKVTFVVDKRVIGITDSACDTIGTSVTLTASYVIVDKRPTFVSDRPAEVPQ